jgi:nicotinamidase-related amidase
MFPTIPQADLEQLSTYTSGHLDRRWGLGDRPAVLVIDMTRSFVADEHSPAFVPTGQDAAKAISSLLGTTRAAGIPTIYTRGEPFRHEAEAGAWLRGRGMGVIEKANRPQDHEIVEELTPGEDDVVIVKAKPSGFYGTQLASVLNYARIDSLIITGVTTSGCVRATVNDAFNLNYRMVIPVECVEDRARISHEVELFDMAVKYADVAFLEEIDSWL